MEYILETKDLTKTIKGNNIVQNVSMHIPKGKVYALLGQNGAGKSTVLKMLVGISNPTSGSITINGKNWDRVYLNKIGCLIEHPPLYENLTAEENLRVKTTLLEIEEKRIREVLSIVSLTNTGKKRTKDFSLGMKQRLGIALALLNNPQILILDEPTNGLDPKGIIEIRELIRSFAKQGITVIVSSHILSEVQKMADFIAFMQNGKLVYENELSEKVDLSKLYVDMLG